MMGRAKTILVISCGAVMVLISMGTRQSLGVFLQPITNDLGIGRATYSLAVAIQNIIFGLPLIGILADRFGPRWVAVGGGILYAVGMVLIAFVNSTPTLTLTLGLLVGLALSSTTYVVVLGAVAQVVPPERRSSSFGIITAAGSFGMFAMVPVAQQLLLNLGWRGAFIGLAVIVGLTALLAFGFPTSTQAPRAGQPRANQAEEEPLAAVLQRAWRNGSYWLLIAGFFVCGFHVAFIATHLPAFLTDNAVSPRASSWALALIGLANIVGSYLFGYLGDRFRKKYLLSFLYFARAIVISLFLFIPISNVSAIAFGAAIGFLWLGTVPLTSGAVSQIFGARYLATLYGIVFFSHQIGAFFGVWLGGRVYDATGSYTTIWLAAIALSLFAALVHLPIVEGKPAPLRRVVPAAEPA
ncbi:MAG: MFS transporter [Caldilineaceae bacterium]